MPRAVPGRTGATFAAGTLELRNSEVDDLWLYAARVVASQEDVVRFQVTVNDASGSDRTWRNGHQGGIFNIDVQQQGCRRAHS